MYQMGARALEVHWKKAHCTRCATRHHYDWQCKLSDLFVFKPGQTERKAAITLRGWWQEHCEADGAVVAVRGGASLHVQLWATEMAGASFHM